MLDFLFREQVLDVSHVHEGVQHGDFFLLLLVLIELQIQITTKYGDPEHVAVIGILPVFVLEVHMIQVPLGFFQILVDLIV